ncbi:MAG: alpha-L-rhamnosidase, partial [Clostridia bacterium]|nr:alpha-L-rhamnosidase [Clostridia bacterium]
MSLQIRYADKKEERVRRFLLPVRIVKTFGDVTNEQALLDEVPTQSYLGDFKGCVLNGKSAGVLLDFGSEIHGCVRINLNLVNESVKYTPVHIRTGESVSEALAEIGWKNAGNDHALRDGHVILSALSTHDTNESGFRFAYVALDGDDKVELLSIQAIMIARDIPYIGKFECSDMLVNEIWETAAHTVHMCMQDYLWDGIKRDRLVWMGDMHTEILTSLYVFGETDTVSKSLDFLRDRTPDGCWMNNMPTYSLWWVIVQFDLYMRTGNFEYLTEQKEYLTALSNRLKKLVKENGEEDMPGRKFLDWPTSEMPVASHEGIQGLLKLALDAAAYMLAELGEEELSKELNEKAVLMKKHIPEASGNKGAGAILTLSGIADAAKMNAERFAGGGAKGYSSLMGGYILNARAEAGDTEGALKDMREFWGGMLSM